MFLNILQGNVLDSDSDAIVLTVDGSTKGMEGNISRQFSLRWPNVWQDIQNEMTKPIPLGRVAEFETVSDCPFRLVLLASTLHHREVLSDAAKQGIIRDATERSLVIASKYNIEKVASAIMIGGWRMSMQKAFLSMLEGYESARQKNINTDLDVYMLQASDYKNIRALACNIGWR